MAGCFHSHPREYTLSQSTAPMATFHFAHQVSGGGLHLSFTRHIDSAHVNLQMSRDDALKLLENLARCVARTIQEQVETIVQLTDRISELEKPD
jgi:hypothetical protein